MEGSLPAVQESQPYALCGGLLHLLVRSSFGLYLSQPSSRLPRRNERKIDKASSLLCRISHIHSASWGNQLCLPSRWQVSQTLDLTARSRRTASPPLNSSVRPLNHVCRLFRKILYGGWLRFRRSAECRFLSASAHLVPSPALRLCYQALGRSDRLGSTHRAWRHARFFNNQRGQVHLANK